MEYDERFDDLRASIIAMTDAILDQNILLTRNNELLEQNAKLRETLARQTLPAATSAPVTRPAVPIVPGGKRHQEAAALGRRPVGRPPKPRPVEPDRQVQILAPSIHDGLSVSDKPDTGDDDAPARPTPRPAAAPAASKPLDFDRPTPGTPQARAADLIRAEIDPDTVDLPKMKQILGALCDGKVFPETLEARRDMVRDAMVDVSDDPSAPFEKFTEVPADLYPAMFASLGTRLGVFSAVEAPASEQPAEEAEETEDWP